VWYFSNTALAITDASTAFHPGLIIAAEDGTIFVVKGTSGPGMYGASGVAVYPSQFREAGKGDALRSATYFDLRQHYPLSDTSSAFGSYIGRLTDDVLAQVRGARRRAAGGTI
jgi:hypothetical protein